MAHFTEEDPYYQEMINMTAKNIEDKAAYRQKMETEYEKYFLGESQVYRFKERDQKRDQCVSRKNDLQNQNLKMKYFQLNRWTFLKQIREDMHVYYYKLYKRIWGMTQMAKHIKGIRAIKKIANTWNIHLLEYTKKMREGRREGYIHYANLQTAFQPLHKSSWPHPLRAHPNNCEKHPWIRSSANDQMQGAVLKIAHYYLPIRMG